MSSLYPKKKMDVPNILIVDDEKPILELWIDSLDHYNVIPFYDGIEAVDYFADHAEEIDMVILDVVMPRIDGVSVFKLIRSKSKSVPVLFSTACFSHYDHSVLREPEVYVIYKPYGVRELRKIVNHILERKNEVQVT